MKNVVHVDFAARAQKRAEKVKQEKRTPQSKRQPEASTVHAMQHQSLLDIFRRATA